VIYYFTELWLIRLSSMVLYFGYMSLVSAAFALATGSIGFLATFLFLRKIFSVIKVA
jgi:transmembrane 9 superfamily protein 2/4